MNDRLYAQQQLFMYQQKLNDWIMHGYDTPVMTYHEQLDEYKIRVEKCLELLKELK